MQDHAAQDVDVEEAKRTDAAIAAVIETADPRDFEDDAGPAYADEDFEEEASSDADASGVEAAIEVLSKCLKLARLAPTKALRVVSGLTYRQLKTLRRTQSAARPPSPPAA